MPYSFRFAFPTTSYDPTVTTHLTRSETAGSAVAANDLIVVAVPYIIAGDTTMTVTDDLGNTYTQDTNSHIFSSTDNNIATRFFYCFVTVPGTPTITATAGVAASFFGVFALVYRGVASFQGSTTDKRTASGTAGTDTLTTNSFTVSTAPAMAFSFGIDGNIANGDRMTAGTGATVRLIGQKSNSLADFVALQDERVLSGGSNTSTFSLSQSGSAYHAVQLLFTESGGPPDAPYPNVVGPGVSVGSRKQFLAPPRNANPPVGATVGLVGAAAVFSTGLLQAPSGSGFIPQPGPGNSAPFNLNQFNSLKGKGSTDIIPSTDVTLGLNGQLITVTAGSLNPGSDVSVSLTSSVASFLSGALDTQNSGSLALIGSSASFAQGRITATGGTPVGTYGVSGSKVSIGSGVEGAGVSGGGISTLLT